jgi:hypothetical protein
MNLKNSVIHEIHEKTRKYSNTYPYRYFTCQPSGELLKQSIFLFYFVNFVFFVDKKGF